MKILLFLLLTSVVCSAQTSGNAVSKDFTEGTPQNTEPTARMIRGVCELISDSTGVPNTPCAEVMLQLTDASGKGVTQTRTNDNGAFEFFIGDAKPYTITSASRFYVLVSPTGTVHAGQAVSVRMKHK